MGEILPPDHDPVEPALQQPRCNRKDCSRPVAVILTPAEEGMKPAPMCGYHFAEYMQVVRGLQLLTGYPIMTMEVDREQS